MPFRIAFSRPSSVRLSWSFVLSLHLLSLSACKSLPKESAPAAIENPPVAGKRLGLNDVSVLFPLHLTPGLRARLPKIGDQPNPSALAPGKPSAPLDGQAFVPPWVADKIIGGLLTDFAGLSVTALRFDPCANALQAGGAIEKCVSQLRLVWQNLQGSGDEFKGSVDTGVHAVYSLRREESVQIVQDLRTLHQAASIDSINSPLLPHPVIAAEGLSSPYLAGIVGLIHRYARASTLTHIAFMRRTTDLFPTWEMAQFSIEAQQAIAQNIPALKQPALLQRFRSDAPVLGVDPQGSTVFGLKPAFLPPGMAAPASDQERVNKPFQSALAIENPLMHNPLNIDCGSCHRSAALLKTRLEAEKAGRLGATPNAYVSNKWNLQASAISDAFSLHMFSYFLQHPEITPRVVNESAEVLNHIEQHFP